MYSLKVHKNTDEVIQLLKLCLYAGSNQAGRIVEQYGEDPTRELLGIDEGGELAGVMGVHSLPDGTVVLAHLAVSESRRKQGIGTKLIKEFMIRYPEVLKLVAETDRDAVDFYRKAGFQVTSLGEKYPGVERFLCTLKP